MSEKTSVAQAVGPDHSGATLTTDAGDACETEQCERAGSGNNARTDGGAGNVFVGVLDDGADASVRAELNADPAIGRWWRATSWWSGPGD